MAVVSVVRSLLGPLVRVPQERPRRWYEVIVWWELRRIPYNLIVGIVGMGLMILFMYIDTLPPSLPPEEQFEPFLVVFVGPFLANFFYTGGWVCELVLRQSKDGEIQNFGPVMFSLGLLLPLALGVWVVVFNVFLWLSRVVIGEQTLIGWAGAHAGAALLLAGGVWYARRRWRAG